MMRGAAIVQAIATALATTVFAATGAPLDTVIERLADARGAERLELLERAAETARASAPRDAIGYAEEGVELARRLGDAPAEARALKNVGIGHYLLGEYDTALEHYERSLERSERAGYREGIAGALNNIGILHYLWGQYDRALEHYGRALEIQRDLDDRLAIAKSYNNLGNVYYVIERYDESLRYLRDSLEVYEGLGERGLVASSLNNIALVLVKQGRFDEALPDLERALSTATDAGDRHMTALSHNNLGLVHEERGDLDRALDAYTHSLEVRREIEDRQGVAISLHNVAVIHTRLGEYDRALETLDEALEVATAIRVTEIERDIHLAISDAHERRGDAASALEAYKRHKVAHDALFDEETSRRISELETKHEMDRKNREIEILRRNQELQRTVRNILIAAGVSLSILIVLLYRAFRAKDRAHRELRAAHEALRVAQEERVRAARAELAHVSRVATLGEMTSALAHEIKQPLTAILSNAQAARRFLGADRPDLGEVDGALGDIAGSADRAREIIARLRHLMRGGEPKTETLVVGDALRDIEVFLRADAAKHDVGFTLDVDAGVPPVAADRIQLQQVALNLVHNATEAVAATGRAGEIRVRVYAGGDGTVRVAVVDDGDPVPGAVVERMFEPFYTTKGDGLGMGLAICRTIAESHDGELVAERNATGGLTVELRLPATRVDDVATA